MKAADFEPVIGLEVHVQLATQSKLFCACKARMLPGDSVAEEKANANTCPVCTAQPGTLPMLNQKAVHFAVMAGLALRSEINLKSYFERKNYFYPDLPKGYQISQLQEPLCKGGEIYIRNQSGTEKKVRIHHIHLEEDAGKSVHQASHTLVNLNRASVPLIEVVSQPDMVSAQEAGDYLRKLYAIVTHLGICDGNLQEGNFRCDANVSVRPRGSHALGTRTEIKNINSFRFVEKAIDYEIGRQIEAILSGQKIVQETRNYDAEKNLTTPSRSKEEAHDYRYFPDPDLVPVVLEEAWLEEIKSQMPELPAEKQKRLVRDLGIGEADAAQIIEHPERLKMFEEVLSKSQRSREAAQVLVHWMNGEISRLCKEKEIEIGQSHLEAQHLADLLQMAMAGELSSSAVKQVIGLVWHSGETVKHWVDREGLKQVNDSSSLEALVEQVLNQSPQQVQDFLGGKEKVMTYFLGQAMKLSKGQANPQILQELFRKKLLALK